MYPYIYITYILFIYIYIHNLYCILFISIYIYAMFKGIALRITKQDFIRDAAQKKKRKRCRRVGHLDLFFFSENSIERTSFWNTFRHLFFGVAI